MSKQVPVAMYWLFNTDSLRKKAYLRDLDFIKENTAVNLMGIATTTGAVPEGNPYFHEDMKELVEYAHKLGIRVVLRNTHLKGFFDEKPFIIDDCYNAQGIVYDIEGTVGEDGYAEFTQAAKWARPKLQPLWNRPVKAYIFDSCEEGFYDKSSLVDVTDKIRATDLRSDSITLEIYAGKENAGKHIFLMTVQYFNWCDCFGDSAVKQHKATIDYYADIPFDGYCMDETGYMVLDFIYDPKTPPFRGRLYSEAQKEYFKKELGTDLDRLLFDMRYAPYGEDSVRIKAINTYFAELQKPPLRIERQIADYEKKIWGNGVFLTCHNTFHNHLDNDEIWRTGCRWWDLPRDFGHTDENMQFPVRMGISFAAPEPICLDMFYHREQQPYYDHIVEGAPFCCRQFHHAYNDGKWGQDCKDVEFLKKMRKLDETVAYLDGFQTERPKLDLLIIYGNSAQNNWYPNKQNRNLWDLDGSLKILEISKKIWDDGYRCALIPDYTVSDGRTVIKDGKIFFNGHPFSHLLFLYPQYAKKEVISFLNEADNAGVPIKVIGRCDLDFDADSINLTAPHCDVFGMSVLEELGCPKGAVNGGCVYEDGSFSLVSHGILSGEATEFDFTVDGIRYNGMHTGLLAYRKDVTAFATAGSSLFADGNPVKLEIIEDGHF